MNENGKKMHLVRKLYQVFKDGYRPARGNESYRVRLKNGVVASEMVNCLGHTFNLRNQQFDDYQFKPYLLYGGFKKESFSTADKALASEILDFIRETGLRVAECDPSEPVTDFKSWKIALYFSCIDMHFMLANGKQNWSSKIGKEDLVEQIHGVNPPAVYELADIPYSLRAFDLNYYFYNTYKITNPNANENNRYLHEQSR